GSPARVTVARLAQIDSGKIFQAPRRVKAGSQLVGERLVVDEAVCACRRDGALVKGHCVLLPALDARKLRRGQCGAAAECDGRIFAERSELRKVRRELLAHLRSCGFISAVQTLGASKRPIEVMLCELREDVGAPQQWPGGLRRSDGASGIAGEKLRLLAAEP